MLLLMQPDKGTMECTVLVAVSGSDMWSAVGYAGLVLGNPSHTATN